MREHSPPADLVPGALGKLMRPAMGAGGVGLAVGIAVTALFERRAPLRVGKFANRRPSKPDEAEGLTGVGIAVPIPIHLVTGMFVSIDRVGRVVIPKALRVSLGIMNVLIIEFARRQGRHVDGSRLQGPRIFRELADNDYFDVEVFGIDIGQREAHESALDRWWKLRLEWANGQDPLGGRFTPADAIDVCYPTAGSESVCTTNYPACT